MEFIKLVLLELILLFCASFVFWGGKRGLVSAAVVLSGINYWYNPSDQFLKWEIILFIGVALGFGVMVWLNSKANKAKINVGLMGGIIGLVVFGAFVTPVLAIILWLVTIGLGLLAGIKGKDIIWGAAPALWRTVLAVGMLIYGNIVS